MLVIFFKESLSLFKNDKPKYYFARKRDIWDLHENNPEPGVMETGGRGE